MIHDTLFKRDSAGRIRFWKLESEGSRFRTISGIWPDGAEVTSGWTTCTPRSQPTAEAQCAFEVEAKYKHQLDREYHRTVDTVDEPNFFEPMLAKTYAQARGS